MHKDRKLVFFDLSFVLISLYFAFLLKFDFNIPKEYITFMKLSIVPLVIIIYVVNVLFKLYSSLWKYASVEETLSIVYSVSFSNIIFVVYSYFITYKMFENVYYRFPLTVHIIFWVLSVVFLGGIRFIYRILENSFQSKNSTEMEKRVLIIGAGDAACLIIREIKRHKDLNYSVVGLIDDDVSKRGKLINGIKVLGGRNEIKRLCTDKRVEEIIWAIPSADSHTKRDILGVCKATKCKVTTLPGLYEIIDGKVNITKLRDINIEDLLGREEVSLNNENIEKYIKGKTVLVTGGGGSIGSEICRQISKYEPKLLLILDIYENNVYDLENELNRNFPELNKQVIIASIRDLNRLKQVFEKYLPEVIFHAAAHKHVPLMEANPAEAVKNNILGTYNVLKCADEYHTKKFVQISTDKAVNPTNIMGATKRFCEIMVQAFDKVSKTEYVAVRFGNVLGSNGSVIPLFKNQIASGGPVTVTHPEINRFFMTIPEAAQLVIQAGGMAKGGEIFVLDMGEPVKIVDLARDLITLSGYKPDVDIKIEYTGLRPGEKLYEELLMDEVALTSTEHNKIFVEKPMDNNMEFVEKSIEEFRNVINHNKQSVFNLMEEKVPTYMRKKD